MPVTNMTIKYGPIRPKPREGDCKTDKDGVAWTRRARIVRGPGGRVEGYDCTGGRQRYVWVREGEAYP